MEKSLSSYNKIISNTKKLFKSESIKQGPCLHDVLNDQLYTIDDSTASDLMLNEFQNKYDHTFTDCGSQLFFHWLHSIKNEKQITNIQHDMKIIEECDTSAIEDYLERKTGKQNGGNIIADIWNGFTIHNFIIDNFYIIFVLNLAAAVLLSFLFTRYTALFVFIFFFINFLCYILTNKKISSISSSIGYFIRLNNAVNFIGKKYNLKLSVKRPECKQFNKLFKYTIFFKSGIGGPQSGDIISAVLDYVRIFLSMELFAFRATRKIILKNNKQVRDYILYVAYIDCLLNSKKIMYENKCCFTKIINTVNDNHDEINFIKLNHPLVENSYSQDKCISKNLIVTGMNMSGKTTFMKSLGLNQILATSFGFCFAEEFSTVIYDVLSSITVNDKLLEGMSRYYAEAERLVVLGKKLSDHKCLCLVDEILSGTNSDERIQGSIMILEKFATSPSKIIAATHDTEIAEKLSAAYFPVYFDGEVKGKRIDFDFKIKDGIVSKKNGLLLLKYLGF